MVQFIFHYQELFNTNPRSQLLILTVFLSVKFVNRQVWRNSKPSQLFSFHFIFLLLIFQCFFSITLNNFNCKYMYMYVWTTFQYMWPLTKSKKNLKLNLKITQKLKEKILQFVHCTHTSFPSISKFCILLQEIKYKLTFYVLFPDLVENRICHNLSTIQLNGGVNNEPPKIPPSASPPIAATTCLTTSPTISSTNNSGCATKTAPVAQQDNSDVEANSLQTTTAAPDPTATAASIPVEAEEEEGYSLLKYPWGKSCFAQFTWLIIWPIHLLFRVAIPDCKKAKNNKIFPLTFVMCIVWIGSLSYVVAWMITIIGKSQLHFHHDGKYTEKMYLKIYYLNRFL